MTTATDTVAAILRTRELSPEALSPETIAEIAQQTGLPVADVERACLELMRAGDPEIAAVVQGYGLDDDQAAALADLCDTWIGVSAGVLAFEALVGPKPEPPDNDDDDAWEKHFRAMDAWDQRYNEVAAASHSGLLYATRRKIVGRIVGLLSDASDEGLDGPDDHVREVLRAYCGKSFVEQVGL